MKLLLYLFFAWLPIAILAAIASLPYNAAAQRIKVSWDANVEPEVSGYRVLYGPASWGWNTTNTVLGRLNNSVTITNMPYGASYIVVVAFADDGRVSQPSYEVITVNTNLLSAIISPPKGLKAVILTNL